MSVSEDDGASASEPKARRGSSVQRKKRRAKKSAEVEALPRKRRARSNDRDDTRQERGGRARKGARRRGQEERGLKRQRRGSESQPEGHDQAFVLARPDHSISRKNISHGAIKVLYRLSRSGYRGFLVGGSVRDLMLGRQPKDFDISTDATPNEIRRLFGNSRIIGRRFRLVHVMFRGEVVEVSTFRAPPDPDAQKSAPGDLLVTNDNTFGTPRDDAFRRDFTINALFYDISDFSVIDYVGGIEDLTVGLVRVIGDPDVRFSEDPVRMMRACEFAGRLGFAIDPETQRGIQRNRKKIAKASPARLVEELIQMLRSGAAGPTLQWMLELGLLELLLPEVEVMLASADTERDFSQVLPAIDRAVKSGGAYANSVLVAALLAPKLLVGPAAPRGEGHGVEIQVAASD